MGRTLTYAAVVMPDHIHWLFQLHSSSLSKVIQTYKSWVGREFSSKNPGIRLWQQGFHDSVIRNDCALELAMDYVRQNPWRSGLVDWPWVYPRFE